MIVIQILIGLVGLGLMVFIHELGHFLAARAVGIRVEAFALGWGPTIWRRRGKQTEYRLAAFPIGGYCKMKGEQDMADALQNKTDHMTPSPGSFFAASPWRRMIVSFAGPFVNLVFAVLVMGLIWWVGYTYESTDNRVVLLSDYPIPQASAAAPAVQGSDSSPLASLDTAGSPAALAGLKSGDRITSVDGKETRSFRDIQMAVAVAARQKLALTVDRDGTIIQTSLTPLLDPDTGGGKIGIRQWIEPVIAKVPPVLQASGLQAGDRIAAMNSQMITHVIDLENTFYRIPALPAASLHQPLARLTALLRGAAGPGIDLQVVRDGSPVQLRLPYVYTQAGVPYLPVGFRPITYHTPALNFGESVARGGKEAFDTLWLTVRSLGLLFQGLNPTKAVSGPIRITYYVGEVATQGFSISFSEGIRSFFHFLAFISIALFFGNLLPIPALDGGQLLLFIGEAISRKPLKPGFVQKYQIIGAVLVFGLLILAVSGDVLFLFGL